MNLTWITCDNPPGHDVPAWKRSAAVAEDGTVYAPVTLAGDEHTMLLKAGWDGGIGIVTGNGHIYLPTHWLAKEDPGNADVYALIERKASEVANR